MPEAGADARAESEPELTAVCIKANALDFRLVCNVSAENEMREKPNLAVVLVFVLVLPATRDALRKLRKTNFSQCLQGGHRVLRNRKNDRETVRIKNLNLARLPIPPRGPRFQLIATGRNLADALGRAQAPN